MPSRQTSEMPKNHAIANIVIILCFGLSSLVEYEFFYVVEPEFVVSQTEPNVWQFARAAPSPDRADFDS
jgi:hypothetical protein